ncbi:MAG: flagellar export chaperone FliS [Clostridiales bacterium]|nr:flagellar export chaperone FliS [Clostridiales bacterium]
MVSSDLKRYREQYISTMTPSELVTLLYNETIKNLKKSLIAIENKDIFEAHNSIIKAQNIIMQLIKGLDFSYPISTNLMSLYEYMYSTLVKANVEKSKELVEHVIAMITDLKNTWIKADKLSRIKSYEMESK